MRIWHISDTHGFEHLLNIPDNIDYPELGWCNNLKGFIPYRYFIDNKIEL